MLRRMPEPAQTRWFTSFLLQPLYSVINRLQARRLEKWKQVKSLIHINWCCKSTLEDLWCGSLSLPRIKPRSSSNFQCCHVTCNIQYNLQIKNYTYLTSKYEEPEQVLYTTKNRRLNNKHINHKSCYQGQNFTF